MAYQKVTDMIKYVRSILEENVSSVPLEGVTDVGTISINTVIENILRNAVDSVSKIAPASLFSDAKVSIAERAGEYETPEPTADDFSKWDVLGANGAFVFKPTNLLRCLYIEAENWERPVTVLTPLSSPYVSIARSEINMSAGNPEKPLATEAYTKIGLTPTPNSVSSGDSSVAMAAPVNPTPGGLYRQGSTIEIYPKPVVGEGAGAVDKTATFVYINRADFSIQGTSPNQYKAINCDNGVYHAACFYAAYLVASIKGYANADRYKASAMDALGVIEQNTNATAGAEVGK